MLNFFFRLFDVRSELQVAANDRNMILVGYDKHDKCNGEWMVLDASGNILAIENNQAEALASAIFKPLKTH